MTYCLFTMFGTVAEDRVEVLTSMLDRIDGKRERMSFLEMANKAARDGGDGIGMASGGAGDFEDFKAVCAAVGLDWRIDTRDERGAVTRRTIWKSEDNAITTFYYADDGVPLYPAAQVARALDEAGAHGLLERLLADASDYDVVALVIPKSAFEAEPTRRLPSFLRRTG